MKMNIEVIDNKKTGEKEVMTMFEGYVKIHRKNDFINHLSVLKKLGYSLPKESFNHLARQLKLTDEQVEDYQS